MKFLIAIAVFLTGCASTEKAARSWKSKDVSDSKTSVVAEINDVGGEEPCLIDYGHGLGEDIESPRESFYGTKSTVAFVNSSGCSHVLSVGYEADTKAKLALMKSDPAFMLKLGTGEGSVEEFTAATSRLIEKNKLPKRVVGLGISMGASNLLTVAIAHPEFFDKLVLLNPMLLKPEEWSNEKIDWVAMFKGGFKFEKLDRRMMSGSHFPDENEWKTRANPFSQLERATKLPPIFVTACKTDEFGLGPATEEWVKLAKERGFDVTFNYVDNCKHTEPSFDGIGSFIR